MGNMTHGGLTSHEMRLLKRSIHILIDGASIWEHKTGAQQTCCTTTLQADTDLFFQAPVGPNQFAVSMHLSMTSPAAADLKLSLCVPCGVAYEFTVTETRQGATQTIHWDNDADLVITTANCTIEAIEVQGIITQPAGQADGQYTLKWAANVACGGATVMRVGSWMQVTRMHGNVHEFPGQYRDD